MVCPYCSRNTIVINSRSRQAGLEVWRRRKCIECRQVFTTHEAIAGEQALLVQRQKQYEPFQRDKLFLSIFNSLQHRKTAVDDATALTATVITKLKPAFTTGAVPLEYVLWRTQETLQHFDSAAATHYKAFHPAK